MKSRSLASLVMTAFLLVMTACLLLASTAHAQREEEDHALRRQEYLSQPREYPFDRIPAGALLRAQREMQTRFGLLARSSMPMFQLGLAASWTSIGPTTINNGSAAGRVTAIAVDPATPGLVYAGGAQGGVWRSLNGGLTWTALTDNQCSLAVGSIAIDPINPKIVYVGTGEQNNSADSYYGCGVLRSSDGGNSWTQLGADVFVTATGGARIGHLLVDRASAGSVTGTMLLASTSLGLFRSTDSGLSWTRVFTGNISGLVADPVDSRTYYMAVGSYDATRTGNGVFKSTDNGLTWTQLPLGLTTIVGRIELAIAPSNNNILYAAIEDRTPGATTSTQLLGIWRTSDAGATWVKTTSTGASCASQCWYDMNIAVDPTSAARVYFGGLSFYRSEDSAATFLNVGNAIHVDHHAIAFEPTDPNAIFVGSDGGVYRTSNRGVSWFALNSNLAITQFYHGVGLHPTDTNTVIGGTQDNGTLQYSGQPGWTAIMGGDGGFTAINPRKPAIMFAEFQWSTGSGAASNGPRRRDAIGGQFRLRSTGIDGTDRAQFIAPYVMDQTNPETLYLGTFRIYRTSDNAESWQAISPDLSKTGTGTVTAIGVAPTDANTIYVGLNDGNVKVTRDTGLTWNTIIAGLPNRVITEIVVDDEDPQVAYLTNSGFGTPHVWRTTDAGASWTNISGDLPNVPVNALALAPRTKDLFIGTDIGVFRSINGGQSWVPFMAGFPNVAVFSLVFSDHTRQLVAGTHGRGVFSYSMPALVLRGDVDLDGKVTAADAQLVLMAAVGLRVPRPQFAYPNGDANCDGVTNALDAQIILSFVVGQPTAQFCVNTVR